MGQIPRSTERILVNLKIRHGAIVDNVVTYVSAKFGDDRL